MAGHSHWAQIKHKKALTDKRKGQLFSKLTNEIIVAAREGADLESNFKLRSAVERAKKFGLPQETIEKAILRGSGALPGEKLEEVVYEAYGPFGSALIIKAITDNRNRTLGELKHFLNRYQGKLAEPGSVLWLFDEKGVIRIKKEDFSDELALELIEQGVEDLQEEDEAIIIVASVENLEKVKNFLEKKQIEILEADSELLPKNSLELQPQQKDQLKETVEKLLELPDVKTVFTNVDI